MFRETRINDKVQVQLQRKNDVACFEKRSPEQYSLQLI